MTRPSVAARLRALAAVVEEHARGVTEGTPDAVHDVRVACRRLETALRLWGRGPDARAARREARALRRTSSPTREAEALRDLLKKRWVAESGVPLAERRAWIASLGPACEPPALVPASRTRLAVATEAAAQRLEQRGVRADRVRTRLGAWRTDARRQLTMALAQDGDAALHRARIALKRWRYAEEALARGRRVRSERRVQALRRWQRELGALHDLSSLASFVLAQGEPGRPLAQAIDARRLARLERLRRRRDGLSPPRPRRRPAPG
jgi:CHAD domain-containing protein